jgi:hypothetical protein
MGGEGCCVLTLLASAGSNSEKKSHALRPFAVPGDVTR